MLAPMFKPILTEQELPPELATHETFQLDFKRTVSADNTFEMAKDVAAFANGLGGVLLVGAVEDPTNLRLGRYAPLSESEAAQVARAYEHAVRDRCRPQPLHQVIRLPKGSGFVVAVNVWPFPGQPVGVGKDGGASATTFAFPVRCGVDTVYLSPDQLPMFIDAKARRIAILLGSILPDRRAVKLILRWANAISATSVDARLEWSDLHDAMQSNTVWFTVQSSDHRFSIPLDYIESVWQHDSGGKWTVATTCSVSQDARGKLVASPR